MNRYVNVSARVLETSDGHALYLFTDRKGAGYVEIHAAMKEEGFDSPPSVIGAFMDREVSSEKGVHVRTLETPEEFDQFLKDALVFLLEKSS